MGRRTLGALAALCMATAVLGCGGVSSSGGDGALRVVATTTQLGDLARAVAGDDAEVTQILRPNTDPHDYEPRPSDVVATANARVILESGDGLDAWMKDVVGDAGGGTQVDVGSGRPVTLPGERSGPEASRFDPHWWHDPRNVEFAVGRIRDALSAADPQDASAFARRATAYVARVRTLDRGIERCMAELPAGERKLVTDHDAFGYFARRYGITVVGAIIPSQSTQAQPSAGDIADLTRLIVRERVKAVFPETSVNAKLAQAVARRTGAVADLTLYGDTLGPAGSPGATYLGMEQANADAMVRGFSGGQDRCTIGGI